MNLKKLTAALTAGVLTACMSSVVIAAPEEEITQIKIMPLGDSITDGFTGDPVGGYRKTLWNLLEENGYADSIDLVGPNWSGDDMDPNHAGYSGYAIADIPNQRSGIYNFIDWLMESYPADVVMLQIGTNDILSSYELEGMGDRLELLVDSILTYIPEDGLLYVATIPYMDADTTNYTDAYTAEEMDKAVDDYNAQVKALVAEKQAEGQPIALSDINSQLNKTTDLYDGVHPSAQGYEKMGTYWYGKIKDYLEGNIDYTVETESTETTEPTETTETTEFTEPTETTEFTEPTETTGFTEPTETTGFTEPTETTEFIEEPTETTGFTEPWYEKGDANMNGYLSMTDILLLQKYLLGKESISNTVYQLTDMNDDGKVNVYDLILLKRKILCDTDFIDDPMLV